MKIAITCPVYVRNREHLRFLNLTTESIISKDHDIIFVPVENYVDPEFRPIMYHFNHEPLETRLVINKENSVSSAWNRGIENAQDCDYVLIINTDIIFKSNAIDRLVTFAQTHTDAVMWTMSEYADLGGLEESSEDENFSEHPHFSCFMVKSDFFNNVGKFDENFAPAYCEDGDMHARLALANLKAYIYGGARFYHFGSRTIKSDQQLWEANSRSFPLNQQYFLNKWGHPIVNDVERMREVYFKSPFNSGNKLDYWEVK